MSLAAALSEAFAAVPAASVAVAVGQHVVIEAWGARPTTVFQAASVSKPVAAMVALRLAAEGRLALDADVNEFLTSWQLPGEVGAEPRDYPPPAVPWRRARLWVRRYNGPASGGDSAAALAARGGRVFVTGGSTGTRSGGDYATIAYKG